MSCHFEHLDGVYLLGALAAGERAEFERHLGDCAECSRGLRDLAGLPGLLGRVRPEVVEQLHPPEPVPPTLLPGVVAQARRSRGLRRALVVATVAAVLALFAAVGIGTTLRDDVPDVAAAQRMQSLGTESSGWVSLTERAWGTRIDLRCTYEGRLEGTTTYVLVVRSTDGRVEQVGSWRSAAGKEVDVTLATALATEDIASVEVQTSSGYSVLRLVE